MYIYNFQIFKIVHDMKIVKLNLTAILYPPDYIYLEHGFQIKLPFSYIFGHKSEKLAQHW